jgi:2-isopropylmalate synthase
VAPGLVGVSDSRFVIGKHAGRKALAHRIAQLGLHVSPECLDRAYARFRETADRKRELGDDDLVAILAAVSAADPLAS